MKAPVAEFFGGLAGLPCWGVQNGFGTWIDFQFGHPRLEVFPVSQGQSGPRRSVFVKGEHSLWVDACSWVLSFDGRPAIHEETPRPRMLKSLSRLNGQILTGARIDMRPVRTTLTFDLGAELVMRRYPRPKPNDALWMFSSAAEYLVLTARGQLCWKRGQGRREQITPAWPLEVRNPPELSRRVRVTDPARSSG